MDLNYRILLKISSLILAVTGISMLPSVICAFIYNETKCLSVFAVFCLAYILTGFTAFWFIRSGDYYVKPRDGYLIVAACWIVSCIAGAFPYVFSVSDISFSQALFESTAGFTTTGATVLKSDITLKSLLLYKAVSNWLGGMGILILVVSVLPALGIGGHHIAKAETPAPKMNKITNRISDSSKILYLMYMLLTAIEFLMLALSGKMDIFDSLINTLSTISTSGIMAQAPGLSFYQSFYVEIVITVFTILAAMNFNMYFLLLNRRFGDFFKNVELRAFFWIIAVTTVLISLNLTFSGFYGNITESLRYAFTQVVSFISTSGFTFADFMSWPAMSRMLLFILMFIGGCSASTGGGIKVIRAVVMIKLILRGFIRRIHPRSVVAVKLDDKAVSGPIVSHITTFIIVYIVVFIGSCILLSLDGLDLETTATSAAAVLSNSGIGMGLFGETGNLSMFCPASQIFMSFLMILGRLELFTILLLFFPSFWNPTRQKN